MSNIVEEILKNEIEVLKSKYLPEDTGHLRTAVNVLEERIKELPVSDQAYFTMHNIQLALMEEFGKKVDRYTLSNDKVYQRQWAIDTSLAFFKMHAEFGKNVDFTKIEPGLIGEAAEYFYNFISKE